jgi:sterol desaturase/sphingolipid hydroxylase (fatty acid hydroxylase superfamily)
MTGRLMQLSKFGYYGDFVIYPIVISGLAAAALVKADTRAVALWSVMVVGGAGLWTFMEYVLHRIALHEMRYFIPMHALHHRSPLAFVGTPTWFSLLTLLSVILAPAWWMWGFTAGSGLTAGVMLGYEWYGILHHLIHHRRNLPASGAGVLAGSRARHMRHHFSPRRGNFGVTTAFWDRVFDTVIR